MVHEIDREKALKEVLKWKKKQQEDADIKAMIKAGLELSHQGYSVDFIAKEMGISHDMADDINLIYARRSFEAEGLDFDEVMEKARSGS